MNSLMRSTSGEIWKGPKCRNLCLRKPFEFLLQGFLWRLHPVSMIHQFNLQPLSFEDEGWSYRSQAFNHGFISLLTSPPTCTYLEAHQGHLFRTKHSQEIPGLKNYVSETRAKDQISEQKTLPIHLSCRK